MPLQQGAYLREIKYADVHETRIDEVMSQKKIDTRIHKCVCFLKFVIQSM